MPVKDGEPPVSIDDKNGVCVNIANIGCSGTVESNADEVAWSVAMLPTELFDRRLLNTKYMGDASTLFSDAAFAASSVGGGLETTLAGAGLVLAGPPGAAAGYELANAFYQLTFNPLETALSLASTATAVVSDLNAGKTAVNLRSDSLHVSLGESSATSLVTQSIGNAVSIGVVDTEIDLYASNYSHGQAPGVFHLAGSVLKPISGLLGLSGNSVTIGPLTVSFGE